MAKGLEGQHWRHRLLWQWEDIQTRTNEILVDHLLELSEGDGIDIQLLLEVLACPPQPECPPSDSHSKSPLR